MHQKLDGTNLQNTVSSQPWWRGIGHDTISTDESGEDTTNLSSSKYSNDSLGTKTRKSQDKNGQDQGNDVNKEIQITIASHSDGKYGHEQQHAQHPASTMPPTMGQFLTPSTQLELVGHSIACASQPPYSDPFYGGVMPAYGPQALVHSYCLGVHPARMALPLEMAEEPVYVNAKQYHGILRRRHSRAKAELEKKLIKVRKPYLHESRHLHAMRRARGSGGRFLNTKKADGSAIPAPDKGGIALIHSVNSSDSSPSNFSGSVHSSSGHMEVREPHVQEMHLPRAYSNANGNLSYAHHHQGFQLSAFHSLSGNRTEEGDCLGQQHERVMVNGVQRALTIN